MPKFFSFLRRIFGRQRQQLPKPKKPVPPGYIRGIWEHSTAIAARERAEKEKQRKEVGEKK